MPLGLAVEDGVAAVLGGQLRQLVAQVLAGLLVGVAGDRVGDLDGDESAAAEQAVPAGAHVGGGVLADPAGQEPAQRGGGERAEQVQLEDAAAGGAVDHAVEQHRRHEDDADEQGGPDPGALPALALGQGLAQLEEAQPEQQAGQEHDPADQRDQAQLAVAFLADAGGRQAVFDHGLRVGAEGLDERLAAGGEGAGLDGAAEGLAEVGLEEEILGALTEAGWFSLLAPSIEDSAVSLPPSRYAAEASALVAAVCPPPPWRGICAPGLKSKPSSATVAPIAVPLCSLPCRGIRRAAVRAVPLERRCTGCAHLCRPPRRKAYRWTPPRGHGTGKCRPPQAGWVGGGCGVMSGSFPSRPVRAPCPRGGRAWARGGRRSG